MTHNKARKPYLWKQFHSTFNVSIVFAWVIGFMNPAYSAPTFSQNAMDDAMTKPLIAYGGSNVGTTPSVVLSAQAFHYLAIVTHFNPNATSNGQLLKDRVLAHFRNLTSGGKEPHCGKPLWNWSDGPVGLALLIMKNTPALWDSLSSAEKAKADLLMKALAIAYNWALNDANDFKTGLGATGKYAKTYNPNYIQGGIGIMIACGQYFGTSGCNDIFTQFSFSSYMSQFKALNWSNVEGTWAVTGATLMEKGGSDGFGGKGVGVKVPFVFEGAKLDDPNGIFYAVSVQGGPKPLYNKVVSNTGAGGKAYIISKKSSPVLGQLGMCYEFDSSDSQGARSDALYCYEGWMNSVATRASMMLMGVWGGTKKAAIETQMGVGSADLIFKLQEGYHGVFMGDTRDVYDTGLPAGKGYFYVKNIWDAFVNANLPQPPAPSPSPKPTVTPSPSPKPTVTPSPSPKPTVTPSPKPSPSPAQCRAWASGIRITVGDVITFRGANYTSLATFIGWQRYSPERSPQLWQKGGICR